MASIADNTASSISAIFQEVYSEKGLLNYLPKAAWLMQNVPFTGAAAKLGGNFVQPVVLAREHGFTYQAADTATSAWSLVGANAMTLKRATVAGSNLVGQATINYEAAARAAKGHAAMAEETGLLVENLMDGAAYRLELEFLYGGTGLGVIGTVTDTTHFKISAATWAPAIWAGLENAYVAFYDTTLATLRNGGVFKITAVDMDESSATYRQITISTAAAAVAATDVVFFGGAPGTADTGGALGNECIGVDKIATTSSGNLFGIAVTTSPLWKGATYDVGSTALTVTHILNAGKLQRNKGYKDKSTLLISPKSWLSLVSPTMDPAASAQARKTDYTYSPKRMEFGTSEVIVRGPNGQDIEVVPHLFVKEQEGFLLPMKHMRRVGASEITFKPPGVDEKMIFFHTPDKAGYEFRAYGNQAIFCDFPGALIKLKNIS